MLKADNECSTYNVTLIPRDKKDPIDQPIHTCETLVLLLVAVVFTCLSLRHVESTRHEKAQGKTRSRPPKNRKRRTDDGTNNNTPAYAAGPGLTAERPPSKRHRVTT